MPTPRMIDANTCYASTAHVRLIAIAVREQDDSCLPLSGASVHSRRNADDICAHRWVVCTARACHVLVVYDCSVTGVWNNT
jgi:hypothetical protein